MAASRCPARPSTAGRARSFQPQAGSPRNKSPIPVNGKVTAQFKNVTLDTILDMVSQPPFQRLGISALVNGPAIATWSNGDVRTLSVAANLGLYAPSADSGR